MLSINCQPGLLSVRVTGCGVGAPSPRRVLMCSRATRAESRAVLPAGTVLGCSCSLNSSGTGGICD